MAKKADAPANKTATLLQTKSRGSIRSMFDDVAPTYDFLNHLLSLGIDNYWRAKAAGKAKQLLGSNNAPKILDVATGTGDLAASMAKLPGATVTALDLHEGFAEQLPFADGSFNIVSAGFGVRNFENLNAGMREFNRVLKTGGHALIIEPMIPRNALMKKLYLMYFKKVLPRIASLFSKSTFAYDYLPNSVEQFPQAEAFTTILRNNGFSSAEYLPMTFETSILYIAKK
jgi:demethylmenaquinone methyltransferase/2-methoxy-6-polyprenyl-1,4-benzoquinol methylase